MATATNSNLISGADMLSAIVRYRNRVVVRTALPGEIFPSTWELGFEQLGKIDPMWVWVAERFNQPLGALVASEAHGVAVIWRVVALGPDAATITRRLLHCFLADIRLRGLKGYLTMLNRAVPAQDKLARIIERAGGKESATRDLVLMAGPIPREEITCHQ